MNKLRKYRNVVLILIDILIIAISSIITSFLVNNTTEFLKEKNLEVLRNTIFISVIVYQIYFNLFETYKKITRYENGKDYLVYGILNILSATTIILIKFMFNLSIVGYKQTILSMIIITVSIISYRVIIRAILNINYNKNEENIKTKKNLLIIGAGEAARDIIKIIKAKMNYIYNIVGIIDDNPNKINYTISGIKILGDRYAIQEICKKNNVDTIFFSIANIDNQDKKEIISLCQETNAKVRILPSTTDIIRGKSIMQNLRDVEIDDILGRNPIVLDNKNIGEIIENKCILVTGGGGSIGSELCRQIVKYNPKTLVIFDIYENNLYNIEMELRYNHYDEKIDIVPIVGSVRDTKKLEKVFKEYNPYLVFHAAAHKHVPLMQINPLEAIKNNVIGTYNVAKCADKHNAKSFILISTDKAVNPTNVMGASKRMCEMVIQAMNSVSKTKFVAVRFGNVLGSNGSVVPLFKKQIAAGGPITVTHKEITRFFMTIPEAVGLVLQAMSYAKGGEIFVLDMGEPVKIYDLAISLIKLSGLEPNIDIPIKITGLRPGEKLYEEVLMSEEGLKKTAHDKIFIGKLKEVNYEFIEEKITELKEIISNEDVEMSRFMSKLKEIVPTYKEPEIVNKLREEKTKVTIENIANPLTNNKKNSIIE